MAKELGLRTRVNTNQIKAVNSQTKQVQRLVRSVRVNTNKIKAVNSQVKPVQGLAQSVRVCLGEYEWRMNLIVIEMDDFEVIIGNLFMRTTCVGVFSNLGGDMIMHKIQSCFLHILPSKVEDRVVGGERPSTMQLA